MTMPSCQALNVIEQLVDDEHPTGAENTCIINFKDGSVLTLIFTPPPHEVTSGTIH